jgi:lysophospholipase L1-like esterase
VAKQLVFIGDSLTEWFDWQKRFPEYRVTNLGIAGERIEGLLDRRERIRSRIDNPDYIFLMTGINNIAAEQYDIFGSYRELARNFTTWYKKATTVIQSILPVELPWISIDVIQETNRKLADTARDFNADYLDLFSRFLDSEVKVRSEYLQEDGVHLSSKGYRVWADEVESFLRK